MRRTPSEMPRCAAIDVGTNTVRFLVADRLDSGPLAHVDRGLEITRLGQGVDADRRLTSEAVERTLTAIRNHAERARAAGAERLRIAGTSALRDAANAADFLTAVREATGTDLEVLSGADEGRLAFLGATQDAGSGPFCVCDIGGGSTELVRGSEGAEASCSLEVGSVRLRERCLPSDPPTDAEIDAARDAVRRELDVALPKLGLEGAEQLVGVAGTVTTLAALVVGVEVYEPERIHGTRLDTEAVRSWSERLLGMRTEEIKALPAMQPGRADVIGAGSLVLVEVMDAMDAPDVIVSERDVLDGLILDCQD